MQGHLWQAGHCECGDLAPPDLPVPLLHMLKADGRPVSAAEAYCHIINQPIVEFKGQVVFGDNYPADRHSCNAIWPRHWPVIRRIYAQRSPHLHHVTFAAVWLAVRKDRGDIVAAGTPVFSVGSNMNWDMAGTIVWVITPHPLHAPEHSAISCFWTGDHAPMKLTWWQRNDAQPSPPVLPSSSESS